ncbi:MAG: hypothetical protein KF901_18860 [Myxococcales bacterium]|nr:hypothetical protein [Myxococcales bacterium]
MREALASVANGHVATRVLHRALHLSGEHEIPAGGSRLQRFVERHLRAAAAFVLGDELAESLVEQLAPLVRPLPSIEPPITRARIVIDGDPAAVPQDSVGSSLSDEFEALELDMEALDEDEREREPLPLERRKTLPAPERPMVLVATTDESVVVALRGLLAQHISVTRVSDVVALLEAAQLATPEHAPVVILHGACPSVQPATMATIGEELPSGSSLLLWGVSTVEAHEAMLLSEDEGAWALLDQSVPLEEVADLVRDLLDAPTSGVHDVRR